MANPHLAMAARRIVVASPLALLPVAASANVGTPLLWFDCCWLLIGNFLIGLVEAWLLVRFYQVRPAPAARAAGKAGLAPAAAENAATALFGQQGWPAVRELVTGLAKRGPLRRIDVASYRRACRTMIWANYASAAVGALLRAQLYGLDLSPFDYGLSLLVVPWLLAFGLTLVMENVFVARLCRLRYLAKESWKRTAFVNACTYLPLLVLAFLLQAGAIGTFLMIKPNVGAYGAPGGWVYYMAPNREVRRVRTDGTLDQRVTGALKAGAVPVVAPSPVVDRADLVAISGLEDYEGHAPRCKPLIKGLGKGNQAAIAWDATHLNEARDGYRRFSDDGFTRPQCNSHPGVFSVFVAGRKEYTLDFMTYLPHPLWEYPTLLPGDFYVVQFGEEIVLVDGPGRRLGRLARGAYPSVLLDADQAPNRKMRFFD